MLKSWWQFFQTQCCAKLGTIVFFLDQDQPVWLLCVVRPAPRPTSHSQLHSTHNIGVVMTSSALYITTLLSCYKVYLFRRSRHVGKRQQQVCQHVNSLMLAFTLVLALLYKPDEYDSSCVSSCVVLFIRSLGARCSYLPCDWHHRHFYINMKLFSLSILHKGATKSHLLKAAYDLSSFSFFQRSRWVWPAPLPPTLSSITVYLI